METGETYVFHMHKVWGYRTQEIKLRCQGDLRMDTPGNAQTSEWWVLDFSRLWQHRWGAFISPRVWRGSCTQIQCLVDRPRSAGLPGSGIAMSWPGSFSAFGVHSFPCLLLLRYPCCPPSLQRHHCLGFSTHSLSWFTNLPTPNWPVSL